MRGVEVKSLSFSSPGTGLVMGAIPWGLRCAFQGEPQNVKPTKGFMGHLV